MSLLQILSQTVVEKNPEYHKLSSKKQSELINETYELSLKLALKQVKIPPSKDPIQIAIERKQYYGRRSGKYRKKIKLLDYDFVEKLRKLHNKCLSKDTFTDMDHPNDLSNQSSEIIKTKITSSNKESIKQYLDFSAFSNTNFHSKIPIFKTNLEEQIFKNKTTIRNYITRTKFKLKQSLNEIYSSEYYELIFSKEKKEHVIHVSKSLFQLYELFVFLDFVKKLEKKPHTKLDEDFDNELKYSYDVLFNYFLMWLEKNGKPMKQILELENEIFNNENFMNLNPANPLFEGFTMLIENNIDISKVKEFLNNPGLVKTFLRNT